MAAGVGDAAASSLPAGPRFGMVTTMASSAKRNAAILAEARKLRGLLARGAGEVFDEAKLERNARPAIAALWEGLAWCPLYETCGLVPPDMASGKKRAYRTVSEWNRSRMSKLTRADLPSSFRMVFDDGAGVGFQ